MATQMLIADGDVTNSANISAPPFAAGDRIETNGFYGIVPAGTVLGDGSGLGAVGTGAAFDEQGGLTFLPGAVTTVVGGMDLNNGDLDLGTAEVLIDTTGAAGTVRVGWGDSGARASGYVLSAAGAALSVTGPQPATLEPGTGARFSVTGLNVNGFGDNDGAGTSTVNALRYQANDSAQSAWEVSNLVFDNFKGQVEVLLYGLANMGNVSNDGLYMLNPDAGSGFTAASKVLFVDLSQDAPDSYTTANQRIFDNVGVHGSARMRHPGGYRIDNWRSSGAVECQASLTKAATSQNYWMTFDHQGVFINVCGPSTGWYGSDSGENGHGWALSRIRELTQVNLRGFIWEPLATTGDTHDMFSSNASVPADDGLVSGQVIDIYDWLQIGDHSIVVTMNGDLDDGTGVSFKPTYRLRNGVAVLSNGGRVFNTDEAGTSAVGVIDQETGNIYYDPDNTAAAEISFSFAGAGAVTDIVTPANSDYNARFSIGPHSIPLSTPGNANTLVDIDPQFVDPTRNLELWATLLGDTRDEAIQKLVAAGAPGEADVNTYSFEKLSQFLQNGYVPQATEYQTASASSERLGSQLGVVPVAITDLNGGANLMQGEAAYIEYAANINVIAIVTEDRHNNMVLQAITGQSAPNRVEFTYDKGSQRLDDLKLTTYYNLA